MSLVLLALLAASAIPWESFEDGLERAKKEQRPIFVDVSASWCEPCALMHRTTYVDPEVVRAARALVNVQLDADQRSDLADRLSADRLPALLILDHQGTVLVRVFGFVGADRLAPLLREIARAYPSYREDLRRADRESLARISRLRTQLERLAQGDSP